jgi:parallel beta-helix repeat protein
MQLPGRPSSFVLVTLLMSFLWISSLSAASAQTSSGVHNLNTGSSYATIQEAIDDNSTLDGHVIFADADTYYEHVILYKAVSLRGENSESTIIDGQGNGTVIDIVASNATVAGFTIRNSSSLSGSSGVYANGASYCNISGNVIEGNWYGIWLESCSNQIVSQNRFTNNQNAMYLDSSTDFLVSENSFSNNSFAVWLSSVGAVDFQFNNVSSNNYAVWITQSINLSLNGNSITDNVDGIIVYSNSSLIRLSDNSISSNKDYAISLNDCSECSIVGNNLLSKEKETVYVRWSHGNNLTSNTVSSIGYDGIYLDQSDDNIIDGNVITKSKSAIAVYSSVNNTVSGNNISGNNYGINISNSRNIQIEENNVTENVIEGIHLTFSSDNKLFSNLFSDNGKGMILTNSNGNLVARNDVSKCGEGLRIEDSRGNAVSNNTFYSNSGYGLVLKASNNNTVSNNSVMDNAVGIRLEGSSDGNVVSDNSVSNNTNGICFERSSDNFLVRSNVLSNDVGILLLTSSNGTIAENDLLENDVGFVLDTADFNLIYGNRLAGNTDGIKVLHSRNNTLRLNVVSSNLGVGVYVADSSLNFFLHNDFSNNSLRPASVNSSNMWDDGVEGNFWGYEGLVDANQNGIADMPFVLGVDEKDNFPLMAQYVQVGVVMDSQQYLVGIICNSSISNFRYVSLSNLISFRVSEFQGLGFCRICIPRALIQPTFEVTVDNEPPLRQALVLSNTTHSWLYFSFPYIAGNVRIVKTAPAPPFWTELWFIGIVVLAVIVGVLALAIFLFYRRLGSYRKTIDEFERKLREKESSPLEEARRLFNVDVAERSVKIGKFEEKYGVKIRPRDSLEDIFKALESKKRERKEKDEVNS